MTVMVREAMVEDAEALLELRRTIFAETPNMLWEPDEFIATANDEESFISWLSRPQISKILVAQTEGELVGFLGAVGGDRNRNRHSALVFLGVLRAHWSTGIASAMLRETIAWASTAALVRLELTVHTSNSRAVQIYKRHGFEVEGVKRSSLRVNGDFVDEFLMSRIG